MRPAFASCLLFCALFACSDDEPAGGGGQGGGGSTSEGGSGGSGAGPITGGGGAGDGGAGGAGAAGGGGAGGGEGCPAILITDREVAECAPVGPLADALASTTLCPEDSSVFWPAKVFKIPVTQGACLHMKADNVGSPLGADLFGAIVDPSGASLLFDEEATCSVTNPEGFACPEGSGTMAVAGDAYVIVGIWEGDGCTPMEATPFELTVSVDGTDVDLTGSELCAGDLLEIIP